MGFTSEITDDFNRGDGDSLGANWSEFVGDIDIVSNTAKHISSTGYWAGARYSGAQTSTADEYVQFYSQTYQNDMGVVARWQDSTTFYATRFRGNDVLFMRGDGATDPTLLLDSVNTATGASSHTYKMSVTGTGATVTLKSYYDGIETFSYDDTNALRITTKGYTGIFGYGVNAKYDDWVAGTVSSDGSSSNSPSYSPSVSISPSSSPSLSPSSSESPSLSPSLSPSASKSPSVSPSTSPGWKAYTRGNYTTLPTDDADLETSYSDQDITDVGTSNNVWVGQNANLEYAVHQYKEYAGGDSVATVNWEGKSSIPPSTLPIYLQIYNQNTDEWETLASNNSAAVDTDFTLSYIVPNLTNYKTVESIIVFRVYQQKN